MSEGLGEPVDVAEYLCRRLYEVGIRSVHGLPGDFNLVFLDYVAKAGMKWVGNANELNAAYAADGYARIKGISAVATTFGVGELSALNGMAGAYAEQVPVIHIVGSPSTTSERNRMLLHHTLGDGNFNVFKSMSQPISCYTTKLDNPADIADEIDNAIRECWIKSRPAYIMLPSDMVPEKIDGARLRTLLDLSVPPNDPEREDYVVAEILTSLYAAANPILMVDACAIRHRCLGEVETLLEKTGLPVFVAPMGKGAVNEQRPNFGGVYSGVGSYPHVKEAVETADLVLSVGALRSDFNTAGFSHRLSPLNTIDLHSTRCKIRYSEYAGVKMQGVLRKIVDRIDASRLSIRPPPRPSGGGGGGGNHDARPRPADTPCITAQYLWPRLGAYLGENDIVVTDTGTASFGVWETKLPKGVAALGQSLWGSIGWSVGAAQGAALAAKDQGTDRRTVLIVGDGSFQLTAQEISTMVRHDLAVTVFVVCNEGYTVERFIHGEDAEYNDIAEWRWKDLPAAFGARERQCATHVVKTRDQLDGLLRDDAFCSARNLQFVELHMPKMDAPDLLLLVARNAARTNAKGRKTEAKL